MKDKNMSKEKMYDIAYGTAWKEYYKENPDVKKRSSVVKSLVTAQQLDDVQLYGMADQLDRMAYKYDDFDDDESENDTEFSYDMLENEKQDERRRKKLDLDRKKKNKGRDRD
jgi:hypothetical protein